MNDNLKEYFEELRQISSSANLKQMKRIESDNDKELNPYIDRFTTNQQKERDKNITELLKLYVQAYRYKNISNKWYKNILFVACISILITFVIAFIVLIQKFGYDSNNANIESMIQIISVCVTFLALIISILKIITKYVFPINEEEYITRIVELIQNNDLEHKKENIKVKSTDNNKEIIEKDNNK